MGEYICKGFLADDDPRWNENFSTCLGRMLRFGPKRRSTAKRKKPMRRGTTAGVKRLTKKPDTSANG